MKSFCNNMDGPCSSYAKWFKSNGDRQKKKKNLYDFTHRWIKHTHKINEPSKPKNKQTHIESSGYQRGWWEYKIVKGIKLYGDRWKLNFGGKHTIGYTELEI